MIAAIVVLAALASGLAGYLIGREVGRKNTESLSDGKNTSTVSELRDYYQKQIEKLAAASDKTLSGRMPTEIEFAQACRTTHKLAVAAKGICHDTRCAAAGKHACHNLDCKQHRNPL